MGMHHLNNRVTHYVVGHGPAERLRDSVLNNCIHEYGIVQVVVCVVIQMARMSIFVLRWMEV